MQRVFLQQMFTRTWNSPTPNMSARGVVERNHKWYWHTFFLWNTRDLCTRTRVKQFGKRLYKSQELWQVFVQKICCQEFEIRTTICQRTHGTIKSAKGRQICHKDLQRTLVQKIQHPPQKSGWKSDRSLTPVKHAAILKTAMAHW